MLLVTLEQVDGFADIAFVCMDVTFEVDNSGDIKGCLDISESVVVIWWRVLRSDLLDAGEGVPNAVVGIRGCYHFDVVGLTMLSSCSWSRRGPEIGW